MRSFQSSEPNRTFDTKTEAGDEGKGDVICVRDSDSYGVEIGWVLQTANEKINENMTNDRALRLSRYRTVRLAPSVCA